MKGTIKKIWRKLGARPSFRKINELMFDCSLHGLGILNYENENVSGEKWFVGHCLPMYLKDSSPVFFDVGGNVGSYTKLLRRFHPGALIKVFEPNPKTFAKLEKELSDPGVVLVQKGLGSEAGSFEFYDREDWDGASSHGSLYKDVIEGIHHTRSVKVAVQLTTLDRYCEENAISHINLLKIDTEGHELEVIRGASSMINEGKVDLLHIEFNEMNIVSHVFFRDLAKALPDYAPYRLLPRGVIPIPDTPLRSELFAFQNIIFVHRRFSPDAAMRPRAG